MLGHQGHAAFHWVVKGRGELQPPCVQTPRTSPGCCSPSLRSSLLAQLMFVVFQTSLLLLSPTFSAVLPVRPPKGANPRAPLADEVSSGSAPVFPRAHCSSLALRAVSFAAPAGSMADASVSSRLQAGTVQRCWAEAEMERDLSRFWKGTQGLLRRHSGLWSSPEQCVLTLNLTAGRSENTKAPVAWGGWTWSLQELAELCKAKAMEAACPAAATLPIALPTHHLVWMTF